MDLLPPTCIFLPGRVNEYIASYHLVYETSDIDLVVLFPEEMTASDATAIIGNALEKHGLASGRVEIIAHARV